MTERRFDVICLGRAAVDLYGQQIGGRLEDMQTFAKYVGGSSANVAIGLARLDVDKCAGHGVGFAQQTPQRVDVHIRRCANIIANDAGHEYVADHSFAFEDLNTNRLTRFDVECFRQRFRQHEAFRRKVDSRAIGIDHSM